MAFLLPVAKQNRRNEIKRKGLMCLGASHKNIPASLSLLPFISHRLKVGEPVKNCPFCFLLEDSASLSKNDLHSVT